MFLDLLLITMLSKMYLNLDLPFVLFHLPICLVYIPPENQFTVLNEHFKTKVLQWWDAFVGKAQGEGQI